MYLASVVLSSNPSYGVMHIVRVCNPKSVHEPTHAVLWEFMVNPALQPRHMAAPFLVQ